MRVETLAQLKELAVIQHKAVICPTSVVYNRPIPAAVIINMQGSIILNLFIQGLYVYEKPKGANK